MKKTIDCPFEPFDVTQESNNDRFFMKTAYNQALRAWTLGEIPIGAVAVENGKVIAKACNFIETNHDATAHAEMEIIRYLSKTRGDWRLNSITLYVTKEPCPMCSGAIYKSRISRVVVGVYDAIQGCLGGRIHFNDSLKLYHKVNVAQEDLNGACENLLKTFVELRRKKDKRQIQL